MRFCHTLPSLGTACRIASHTSQVDISVGSCSITMGSASLLMAPGHDATDSTISEAAVVLNHVGGIGSSIVPKLVSMHNLWFCVGP